MTGTCPLLDPDGSKRAAMAASLEYGTHALAGQHTYRRVVTTAVPTIPRCGICGRPRVLYTGVCDSCIAKDEENDQ